MVINFKDSANYMTWHMAKLSSFSNLTDLIIMHFLYSAKNQRYNQLFISQFLHAGY